MMINFKRAFGFMLSLIIVFCALFFPFDMRAFATSEPLFWGESKTVDVGDQFTVKVSLSNATSVYGGNFTLQYDSELLTVDLYEFGDVVSGHTKNCNLDYQSAGNMIRVTFSGASAVDSDGILITFTFTAKAEGAGTLEFVAHAMYDENGMAINSVCNDSTITIEKSSAVEGGLLGDVNIDGRVNVKDATMIQKAVASLIVLSDYKAVVADSDQNGKVNVKDATVIQKYAADMEIPYPVGEPIVGSEVTQPETQPDVTTLPTIELPFEPEETQPEATIPSTDPIDEVEVALISCGYDSWVMANVGDTITYTVDLTADKLFEDIQAYVTYDSNVLEIVDSGEEIPNLRRNGWAFINTTTDGIVKFNASDAEDYYDFRDEEVLITLEFVVKDAVDAEIDFVVEEMSIAEYGGSYFSDSQPVITEGISIKESVSLF